MPQNPNAAIARFQRTFPLGDGAPDGHAPLRRAWEAAVGEPLVWRGETFAATLAQATFLGQRCVEVTGTLARGGDDVTLSVRVEPQRSTHTVLATLAAGAGAGLAAAGTVWLFLPATYAWIAALLALILAVTGDVNAQRSATRRVERRLKTACGRFVRDLEAEPQAAAGD